MTYSEVEAKIPLNNIMKAPGHTKLATLDNYSEKKQDHKEFQRLSL